MHDETQTVVCLCSIWPCKCPTLRPAPMDPQVQYMCLVCIKLELELDYSSRCGGHTPHTRKVSIYVVSSGYNYAIGGGMHSPSSIHMKPDPDAVLDVGGSPSSSDTASPYTYANYDGMFNGCLLYTSPSPRDATLSRMPSSA